MPHSTDEASLPNEFCRINELWHFYFAYIQDAATRNILFDAKEIFGAIQMDLSTHFVPRRMEYFSAFYRASM